MLTCCQIRAHLISRKVRRFGGGALFCEMTLPPRTHSVAPIPLQTQTAKFRLCTFPRFADCIERCSSDKPRFPLSHIQVVCFCVSSIVCIGDWLRIPKDISRVQCRCQATLAYRNSPLRLWIDNAGLWDSEEHSDRRKNRRGLTKE